MYRGNFVGLLAIACLLLSLLASPAAAGYPYWTIGQRHHAPQVQPLHPPAYAYGWFGASSRPQAERQTGYYGNYRQFRIK
jgi:hypothetical protein